MDSKQQTALDLKKQQALTEPDSRLRQQYQEEYEALEKVDTDRLLRNCQEAMSEFSAAWTNLCHGLEIPGDQWELVDKQLLQVQKTWKQIAMQYMKNFTGE